MHDQRRSVAADTARLHVDVQAAQTERRGVPRGARAAGPSERPGDGAGASSPAPRSALWDGCRVIVREETHRRHCASVVLGLPVGDGQAWRVTVAPFRDTRTADQNRLYWAIVGELCDASGQDKESMHSWLKAKFIGARFVEFAGEVFEFPAESSKLSVRDFSAYVDTVANWAAEKFGIICL